MTKLTFLILKYFLVFEIRYIGPPKNIVYMERKPISFPMPFISCLYLILFSHNRVSCFGNFTEEKPLTSTASSFMKEQSNWNFRGTFGKFKQFAIERYLHISAIFFYSESKLSLQKLRFRVFTR